MGLVKLLAPFLPYVTEEIYQGLFGARVSSRQAHGSGSLHRSSWPQVDTRLVDPEAEGRGALLVEIATAIRRSKSERNLSLAVGIDRLQLACSDTDLAAWLEAAAPDLASVTRSSRVEVVTALDPDLEIVLEQGPVRAAIHLNI